MRAFMTREDAMRRLGLHPEESVEESWRRIARSRDELVLLMDRAPDDAVRRRYRSALEEWDHASRVWQRADGEAREVAELPLVAGQPGDSGEELLGAALSPAADPAVVVVAGGGRRRGVGWWVLGLLVPGAVLAGGGWWWSQSADFKRREQVKLRELADSAGNLAAGHRWSEAREVWRQAAGISGSAEMVASGMRRVDAGQHEEKELRVREGTEDVRRLQAARSWDAALRRAAEVLARDPDAPEIPRMQQQIAREKDRAAAQVRLADARAAFGAKDWARAEAALRDVHRLDPTEPSTAEWDAKVVAARDKEQADREKAHRLFEAAVAQDHGVYDRALLATLHEAAGLAPDDAGIAALLAKVSAYVRILHVPGDFANLADALADVHDKDQIVLGEGVWNGGVSVDKAVILTGAGDGKTVIQCDAEAGSAVTFGAGAKVAKVTGITFRHEAFDADDERFPVAQVRGGEVEFQACRFADASGHGLEVREGGVVRAIRCRFERNGWDGLSAHGKGVRVEAADCDSIGNFEHGWDFWDGAAGSVTGSRAEGNTRNGMLIDALTSTVKIEGNRLRQNREFGMVIQSCGASVVKNNTFQANQLGGIVVRTAAAAAAATGNRGDANGGPGMILEKGLTREGYRDNFPSAAGEPDLLDGADLSATEPLPEEPPSP